MYKNLLKKFIDDCSDVTVRIAELKENGKVEEAVREAHTVKGVSANLGAEELQKHMAEIELKLKDGGDLQESLAKTGKIISKLVLAINKSGIFIEEASEKGKLEDLSAEELVIKLKEAVDSLSKRKPKPAIEILDSLVEFDLSEDIKNQINEAQKFLGKYKMKDALLILEKVIFNLVGYA